MEKFHIETKRLIITEADESMAESIHENSLDEDTRRFVPDEVFETTEEAAQIIRSVTEWYHQSRAPLVYPVILKSGENIGYVQLVPYKSSEWEIGYHIAEKYTGNGYASEAAAAFLPVIAQKLKIGRITGICLQENAASCAVMEKCGFILEYQGSGSYKGHIRNIFRYSYFVQ